MLRTSLALIGPYVLLLSHERSKLLLNILAVDQFAWFAVGVFEHTQNAHRAGADTQGVAHSFDLAGGSFRIGSQPLNIGGRVVQRPKQAQRNIRTIVLREHEKSLHDLILHS